MGTEITLDEIRHRAFTALSTDPALAAWCTANYPGRGLLVTDGANVASAEELNQYPAIALWGTGEEEGLQTENSYTILVEARISDQEGTNAQTATARTRSYNWPAVIAQFAKLARTVIRATFEDTNAPVTKISTNYSEAAWPIVLAGMTITFQVPNLLGPTLEFND